ncbi:hypothetical protein SAMN04487906_2677 [Zhouia amylolytica]|nr:hypothetical protein SAMN04487906_2677 [Zhouia amylolytica]
MQAQKKDSIQIIEEPLYKPFIERYILDELKNLRNDQAELKKLTVEKIANSELNSADRAIRYTTDTTTNIFYIITIAASILVIIGWRSLTDIKRKVESLTEQKIEQVTAEYEKRLTELENDLILKSKELINTQEKLTITNQIQSLWRRASIEEKSDEKIHIYDQILEVAPNNVEAMTHKADSLLDIGEIRWANSLANQAIDIDSRYYLAYWQRACSNAMLGNTTDAIKDIDRAVKLTELTKEDLLNEDMFTSLHKHSKFNQLLKKLQG